MTKLLHLPIKSQIAPRRVNPIPMALSLALGSLRVTWQVRAIKRRGRLNLILTSYRHVLRAWRLARRAWR